MGEVVYWLLMTGALVPHIGTFSSLQACQTAASSSQALYAVKPDENPDWHGPANLNSSIKFICVAANDMNSQPPQ
jgi:hypothetical protein